VRLAGENWLWSLSSVLKGIRKDDILAPSTRRGHKLILGLANEVRQRVAELGE